MTAKNNSFFWLTNVKKSSPLKQLGQMEPNLAYMVPGCVPFKIVSDSPTLHSRWLLFFKVMIISFWNLLQYHSIVRWAIQAQWAEPLVERGVDDLVILFSNQNHPCYFLHCVQIFNYEVQYIGCLCLPYYG